MIAITRSPSKGTTTLLYLISGILQPQKGKILIDGEDTNKTLLESGMAYISGNSSVFKGSVLEKPEGALGQQDAYVRCETYGRRCPGVLGER